MILENKKIKLRDGIELNGQIKESGSTTWLFVTHGVGEHLGRHNYMPDLFGQDFNVFQYDLRGHGESGGKRAYIDDFNTYLEDLQEIIQILKAEYRISKYIIFGHSLGALITAGYLQKYADKDFYPERIYLSSPPVGTGGVAGRVANLLPFAAAKSLAQIPFSVPIGGLVDLKSLSHDPRIAETYTRDSKNCIKLHSKLLLEIVKASKEIFSRPLRPLCPAFVSIGSEDQVVSPAHLIEYFSTVERGFCLKVFEGAYHEIHNEIDKYRIPYFEFIKHSLMEALYDE